MALMTLPPAYIVRRETDERIFCYGYHRDTAVMIARSLASTETLSFAVLHDGRIVARFDGKEM